MNSGVGESHLGGCCKTQTLIQEFGVGRTSAEQQPRVPYKGPCLTSLCCPPSLRGWAKAGSPLPGSIPTLLSVESLSSWFSVYPPSRTLAILSIPFSIPVYTSTRQALLFSGPKLTSPLRGISTAPYPEGWLLLYPFFSSALNSELPEGRALSLPSL